MKSKTTNKKTVASFTDEWSDLIQELSDDEAAACAGGLLEADIPFEVANDIASVGLGLDTPFQDLEVNNNPGQSIRASRSDRNQKEHFAPVDVQEVLGKVATLAIATWNYKDQKAEIRHIGPMAQDFAAAFGVGEDNRLINVVDADGVALAAIQGLYQQLQEKTSVISTMRAELDALKQQIIEIKMHSLSDKPQATLNCN
ncbi:MAG TPA: hypothetical protein DCE56_01155 [Cyanobacteria bacterium UBA8553]|nr:hypothetical protein [Cyanobacteria bacterium UBA8553]HAJ61095.1 hypothetical protein [Cyanobacteria bacterium UBA8543]